MDSRYILLQEDTNLDYEPTQEEILEEAKYLGIASEDTDLLWIAKEALRAPLPRHWSPYQEKETGSIVYYNKKTGKMSHNHPMDEYFRGLYNKMRDDPASSRIRSASNSFLPETELAYPMIRSDLHSHHFSVADSLRAYPPSDVYNHEDSETLCKEIRQATTELSLYNEWLRDSTTSMKRFIDRMDFLESRMKSIMKTPSLATSA